MSEKNTGPTTGIQEPDTVGGASTPQGKPGHRPTPSAGDRTEPGAPPPGANQGKNEPVPAAPDRSEREATVGEGNPQAHGSGPGTPAADQGPDQPSTASTEAAAAGSAPRAAGHEGEAPRDIETDDAAAARRSQPGSPPASTSAGVPTPGDVAGVSPPAVQAARGTSEDSDVVQGIKAPTNASPGKPDGEVHTRP